MLKKLFLIGLICAFLAPTNVFAEKGGKVPLSVEIEQCLTPL